MPTKLLDPYEIVAGSWKNLLKHWRVYAEFTVWFIFLSIVFWAFGVLTRSLIADKFLSNLLFSLMTLPLSLLTGVLIAAVIDATAKSLQGQRPDVRDSLMIGAHKLIPFIWVSILMSLALIGGFVLVLVPALIFAVWFAFATDFLIVDGVRGSGALRKSKALVAGRWWAVLFRIIIPWLFFYFAAKFALALFYLLLGAVLGDPGMFFGAIPDIFAVPNLHLLVTTVAPQVFYGLTLPLYAAANLILWFNLKKNPAVK